jgi:hypothetical protein
VHMKATLTSLLKDGEIFFANILEKGIFDLEEISTKAHDKSDSIILEHFKDARNISNIVSKFALMSAKRKERNEFNHPFGDHFNVEVRATALEILKTMIDDPFCSAFKHIASLARYSLLMDHSKIKAPTSHASVISKVF